mmetsp:Transcript_16068/g.32673  ORF Transcript_16068/g.32673 Transcript_16068/m.32673 type:complete len:213 (-) Transcript_16068:33-671(-)
MAPKSRRQSSTSETWRTALGHWQHWQVAPIHRLALPRTARRHLQISPRFCARVERTRRATLRKSQTPRRTTQRHPQRSPRFRVERRRGQRVTLQKSQGPPRTRHFLLYLSNSWTEGLPRRSRTSCTSTRAPRGILTLTRWTTSSSPTIAARWPSTATRSQSAARRSLSAVARRTCPCPSRTDTSLPMGRLLSATSTPGGGCWKAQEVPSGHS